ncbi:COG1470 family protein [Paenibacillus glycanilyticus]|uniref:COG1470 family protein n=1 Tax=Paenibacillus glycanilyticus TaxID=126569 RepID=UPI001910A3FA|nr:NEW3 domain-containing protein [Paenibacillus glycanilyticus]
MLQACRKKSAKYLLALGMTLGAVSLGAGAMPVSAAAAVELYTPYLQLSAPPGDSIAYSVDIINHGSSTQTVDLGFDEKGNKWDYELTAGGRTVSKIAVKPGESQTVNLQLDVPLEINKGVYQFQMNADGSVLPLAVQVSEQGTFRTELTTDQPNMQGHSDSTFTFSATLRNRTAEKQTYALAAQAAAGWDVTFSDGSNSVTSVEVDANGQKTITISAKPPQSVQAGTYDIPISASNNSTNGSTTVEAVVTGTYDLALSTPNDLLSTKVTAGSMRKLDLVVTNKGSAELKQVAMTAESPTDWEVTFVPSTIASIKPGETTHVQATIKADKKALAGDYVVNVNAAAPEKSADAQFRVAVKSSVLWGWIGIVIILAVIAAIYGLFRKFGRR